MRTINWKKLLIPTVNELKMYGTIFIILVVYMVVSVAFALVLVKFV